MEKVTEENPHRLSRREFLKAAGITAAAVGVSKLVRPAPQGLEKKSAIPKTTSLPTVGHDVVFISPETNLFIPSPHREPTPAAKENIVAEAKPIVAEANPLVVEEERNPRVAPKESSLDYNLLSPEAFAPYAYFGSEDTPGIEILDYFPQSYKGAPDSLIGLWFQAVGAKINTNPQTNTSLTIEPPIFSGKISFDYLTVPEGTKFSDVQEQEERILPCESNVVVIGKIDGEENFLAVYQEPVNNCYYFAKMGEDVLKGQEDLAASKNLIAEAFNTEFQNLQEIGTPEDRARLYEVKEGDSLASIASHFGLPSWHCVYGKNIAELGQDPGFVKQGQRLLVPDRYKEEEFINFLTPGSKINRGQELYFPETEHYARGAFLEFYQRWGEEILGKPINDESEDGQRQLFRNLVLVYSICEPNVYLPCPEGGDLINNQVSVYPAGLFLYNYQQFKGEKVEIPKKGDFEIGEVFQDFYLRNGGEQLLGFAISPLLKQLDGTEIQWTLNSRLELKNGQIQLAPLGEEFAEIFTWFGLTPEQVEAQEARRNALRAIEEEGPKGKLELEARTVGVLLYAKDFKELPVYLHTQQRNFHLTGFINDQKPLTELRREVRDFLIFEFLTPGKELSFFNVSAALAWHETRFEMNPVVEKALDQLSDGSRVINRLIQEKVIVKVFRDNKYPSLPEDWHDRFVFAGGHNPHLSGGLGFKDAPLLFGAYDQYRGNGANDERMVLEALVQNGLHEGIHSFIQPASKIEHSQWLPKEKPEDPNVVPADARKGLLAHMSMCILTSAAQKHYGFEEKRDPRINYIIEVLRRGGIEDPETEVLQAAVTFNSDRLWDVYERVKKENNPSMDSLMSTQNPDLTIIYN